MTGWLAYVQEHLPELAERTWEHALLSGGTIGAAVAVAVPAGIWLAGHRRCAVWALAIASVIQTVPSLALLGFIIVITGRIGWVPSLLALFLYSLLPILRNTVIGVSQTPPDVLEAAIASGMTPAQARRDVSVPLAAPVILAGIRTAAALAIGTATLCAFVGAGGLGVFINRGLESVDGRLVLLGVIPAAAMALLVDAALGLATRMLPGQRA